MSARQAPRSASQSVGATEKGRGLDFKTRTHRSAQTLKEQGTTPYYVIVDELPPGAPTGCGAGNSQRRID